MDFEYPSFVGCKGTRSPVMEYVNIYGFKFDGSNIVFEDAKLSTKQTNSILFSIVLEIMEILYMYFRFFLLFIK
jgi:hypothetical protein